MKFIKIKTDSQGNRLNEAGNPEFPPNIIARIFKGDLHELWVWTNISEYNAYLTELNAIGLLDRTKQAKCDEIDRRSEELIANGFTYSGLKFSLSITAQINWSNIPHLPEMFYPLTIQAQDNSVFTLAYNDRMNFYYTAVAGKNIPLQTGTALKSQVQALTTVDEVNSFVDNR